MVEYWITDINVDNNKIEEVRALMNTIEGLSNPNKYSRDEIIKSIEKTDDRWYTSILKETKGAQNIWKRGSKIHVVDRDGKKFIRLKWNQTKKDNFDYLTHIKE